MEPIQNSSKTPQAGKTHPLPWLLGGAAILAILFGLGLAPKLQADRELAKETRENATAAPQVEFALPRLAAADSITLPANIQAISTTPIQARTSGYVSKLYVDIGSQVKAGQVLAEIESPDADQQLAQAVADAAKSRAAVGQSVAAVASSVAGVAQTKADLARQLANIKQAESGAAGSEAKLAQTRALRSQAEAHLSQSRQGVSTQRANLQQAKAQYDLAASTVKRYENLLKQGYVAQQDYDQALAGYKSAAATVSASEANLSAAESDVKSSQEALNAMDASVRAAQTDAEAAKANVVASRATYTSLKATVTAANAGVSASKANVQASRAAVASSDANTRRYQVLHSFQTVVAPFDGVITSRNVDIGSLVSPGSIATANSASATTPNLGLFGIARIDTLRVFVNVPQTNLASVKAGNKVKILVRELPNATFEGTILQSAGALDSTSRTLLTEIRLPNQQKTLLPGMYAQVVLESDSGHPILRAPANTLMIDAEGTRVFAIDDNNVVHVLNLTLGRDFGTEVEVLNALQPGQKLITNPNDTIKDGIRVSAKPAPTPPSPDAPAERAPASPAGSTNEKGKGGKAS
jgi:RND family efflux transporter MFP subunit